MSIYDSLGFAPELIAKLRYQPVEVALLAILRPELEPRGIKVHANVPGRPRIPFVLVRKLTFPGNWKGDPRGLVNKSQVAIHVYTQNPDGDLKGVVLGEIVSSILQDASDNHWSDPLFGAITKIEMKNEPTRQSDWATSSGPVQYADLPEGAWRYEAHYEITTRPAAVL